MLSTVLLQRLATVKKTLRETGLARSCHATLRKAIRHQNKSAMIHFETNFNVQEQVSTFYVTWCNACRDLFCSAVAHKFQLKVSMCNGSLNRRKILTVGMQLKQLPVGLIAQLAAEQCTGIAEAMG